METSTTSTTPPPSAPPSPINAAEEAAALAILAKIKEMAEYKQPIEFTGTNTFANAYKALQEGIAARTMISNVMGKLEQLAKAL